MRDFKSRASCRIPRDVWHYSFKSGATGFDGECVNRRSGSRCCGLVKLQQAQ